MLSRNNGQYYKELVSAYEKSKRLKLNTIKPKHTEKRYLTETNMAALVQTIYEEHGVLGPKDVVQQCFGLHYMLAEIIEEVLSCRAYFTLGHVELQKDSPPIFYQSDEDLKHLLKTGITKPDINLHAWITLPSMEILDFSLPTSLNVVNGWDNIEPGAVVTGHADELLGDLKYHPTLLGEDFLRQIGALVEFKTPIL